MDVVADSRQCSQALQSSVVDLKPMTVRRLADERLVSHGLRVVRTVAGLEDMVVHIRVLQKLDWILKLHHRCTRMQD